MVVLAFRSFERISFAVQRFNWIFLRDRFLSDDWLEYGALLNICISFFCNFLNHHGFSPD